jgi:hypothetical protein
VPQRFFRPARGRRPSTRFLRRRRTPVQRPVARPRNRASLEGDSNAECFRRRTRLSVLSTNQGEANVWPHCLHTREVGLDAEHGKLVSRPNGKPNRKVRRYRCG